MENFLQINNDNNGNIFAKMGNAKGTYTYSQLIMRKMREIACALLDELKKQIPIVFDDITYEK